MEKILALLFSILTFAAFSAYPPARVTEDAAVIQSGHPIHISASVTEPTEDERAVSDDEIRLLALLTMAEAEGESEEGQRLVIDTVLNRVDDARFPDDIRSVICQPNQYTSLDSERMAECFVQEELVALVRDELEDRTDHDVIFFRTKRYSKYGTPLFQVGNHYFSSYE